MPHTTRDERRLGGLHPPRRNRYYYAKLMDVVHFEMEQRYELGKRRLLNRMVLGHGVVCGLHVACLKTDEGWEVHVGAGLAIDGWGREILVEDERRVRFEAVPAQGTYEGGEPLSYVVRLCYRECLTDYEPGLVTDPVCGEPQRCEAGTVVETYEICVERGRGHEVGEAHCGDISDLIEDGRIHDALCRTSRHCPDEPEDPCVELASITIKGPDAEPEVRTCRFRSLVPTNVELFQLVTCLAQEVHSCCEQAEEREEDLKDEVRELNEKLEDLEEEVEGLERGLKKEERERRREERRARRLQRRLEQGVEQVEDEVEEVEEEQRELERREEGEDEGYGGRER